MSWITLALSAAVSWGLYGASLSRGQAELGNPLRAMLCVGVAYFLIAVLVPVGALTSQGELRNFTTTGVVDRHHRRSSRRARRGVHHLCLSRRR